MQSYVKLIRLPNLLIIALTQYLVRYALIQPFYSKSGIPLQTSDTMFLLLVLSTILIAAAGYVINDYFDVRIDRFNKPDEIVIGKKIQTNEAIKLHAVLSTIGVILGVIVSYSIGVLKLGLIQVIVVMVLWFYSSQYKRKVFAGNLAVSILAGLTVGIVWLFEFFALRKQPEFFIDVMQDFHFINTYVLGYCLFAFLLTMIREMVKDVEDVEGDREYGSHTFPIKYGIRKTKYFILSLSLITMILLAFGQDILLRNDLDLAFWYLIPFVQLPLAIVVFQVQLANYRTQFHRISSLAKIIMLTGVISMLLIMVDLNARF